MKKQILLSLSLEDKIKLENAAKREMLSQSAYIRRKLFLKSEQV